MKNFEGQQKGQKKVIHRAGSHSKAQKDSLSPS